MSHPNTDCRVFDSVPPTPPAIVRPLVEPPTPVTFVESEQEPFPIEAAFQKLNRRMHAVINAQADLDKKPRGALGIRTSV